MSNVLSEKEFQKYFISKLKDNGYEIWSASWYDKDVALDKKELFRFLNATQPDAMLKINKMYKGDTEDVIIAAIERDETSANKSRLDVMKYGIDINGIHLDFLYSKPTTSFNKELNSLYEQNIFSAMIEVIASDKERIDIVIFINGFAVVTIELKANTSGQSYEDAIYQYRTERNPKTRLFQFGAGAFVHFAIDLEQAYMTTKLAGEETVFLPFNMGKGTGIEMGAGNPILEDEFSVHYMWDNILQKDSLMDIITSFLLFEKTSDGKKKSKQNWDFVFPRYHQIDVVRKILDDVYINNTQYNYLINHSPGSGKTKEISWLAYKLAEIHDSKNKSIFKKVIICTDRVSVVGQLRNAALTLDHKSGFITVMDEKCTSKDLADALKSNTKIIVTTMQKFQYIMGLVKGLDKQRFALIIDEAHSSTSGKNMGAISHVLSQDDETTEDESMEDIINQEIVRNGKQPNVSIFAFTATPKPTTIELFGRVNKNGKKGPFHTYSMKQAIEEGYILDVLSNYVTYETHCEYNKTTTDNPILETSRAKKELQKLADLHPINIHQRCDIILTHFMSKVCHELGGTAKSMVILSSRKEAVLYKLELDKILESKGYKHIKTVVAFSGKVEIDGKEYTESGMNGFSEKRLPNEFEKDENRILIVANKYQTGYDQKKLCALYILKKLSGVVTVQTLCRIDRVCHPYDKKTFILDFVNDYNGVVNDFSKYYSTTLLANSVSPAAVYDLEAKIDSYSFIMAADIEKFAKIYYKSEKTISDKKVLTGLLSKGKDKIESGKTQKEKDEITFSVNRFVRFYEFLLQVSSFNDANLHKKYIYLKALSAFLKIKRPGSGFSYKNNIEINNFIQKKTGEHTKSKIKAKPDLKLPIAEPFVMNSKKEERLSQIIDELNGKTGKTFATDITGKSMLQIRDIALKSPDLKSSAKNNTLEDFEFAFYDIVDEALIEGITHNQEFFTLLLQNEELKKAVLGIFIDEIYNSLRE